MTPTAAPAPARAPAPSKADLLRRAKDELSPADYIMYRTSLEQPVDSRAKGED